MSSGDERTPASYLCVELPLIAVKYLTLEDWSMLCLGLLP